MVSSLLVSFAMLDTVLLSGCQQSMKTEIQAKIEDGFILSRNSCSFCEQEYQYHLETYQGYELLYPIPGLLNHKFQTQDLITFAFEKSIRKYISQNFWMGFSKADVYIYVCIYIYVYTHTLYIYIHTHILYTHTHIYLKV